MATTNTTTSLYTVEYVFEDAHESEYIGAYLDHDRAYKIAKEQAEKAARYHMHGIVSIVTYNEAADGNMHAIIDADGNIRYYGEKDDAEDFAQCFTRKGVKVRTAAYMPESVEPIAF